ALALPGRSRIHLVLGMGFGRRDRGLSQQRRPQGDRAAHARAERGEGGGEALRARAIAAKRGRSRLGSAARNARLFASALTRTWRNGAGCSQATLPVLRLTPAAGKVKMG